MELNGVANIQMILELQKMKLSEGKLTVGDVVATMSDIEEQLDVLNRYLVAIQKLNPEIKIPLWHEVRDNKQVYLNNRGE
jgi:hypothetical protein